MAGFRRIARGLAELVRHAFRSAGPGSAPAGPMQGGPRDSLQPRSASLPGNSAAGPEPIFIGNAGLVLTAPFLPRFFEHLGLLERDATDGAPLLSEEGKARAPHLLQWLVEGRCDRPESMLVLNKLICGLPPGAAVPPAIDPAEKEVEVCKSLLEAMIANWPMVKGTSAEGLRETFLQREGRLDAVEGGWRLEVERKVLDVLVDAVPWSFSLVFHRWMAKPLSVVW